MPSSSVKSLEAEGYTISQFDVQPARFEARPKLFLFSTLAYWSLYSLYFIVHVFVIRSLHWHSSGLHWQLWVLLYTEICLTLQDAILAFNLVQGLLCAADLIPRSRYELNGSRAPTVDVFVPCCGEPVDVILDTVHAVLNQDYPTNRFRVLVLDDGRSEELEDAIQKLNVSINNYTSSRALYLSRTLAHGERSYFKAGNLQYGITESRAKPLDGANEPGGSQFIASLDADMIPHPAWLRCLVPHLLCDRTAAMIAPPQQYYNVPPSDPFGNAAEFARWFDLFEPLNDHLGAAMCTGTGFVLRREAVERIGGWPLVETGEDFLCGCLLSDAGWKVLYTNEALQCGLAPASLKAHVAQRMRWVDSGIEVHKRFGFYLPGSRLSQGMTLGQRLVALTMMLREYAPLLIVPALLLLPLAVFPGPDDELILLTGARESTWLGWLFAAAWLTGKVNCAILYTGMDAQGIANFQANDIWCSPCKLLYFSGFAAVACMLTDSATRPSGPLPLLLPASLPGCHAFRSQRRYAVYPGRALADTSCLAGSPPPARGHAPLPQLRPLCARARVATTTCGHELQHTQLELLHCDATSRATN